MSTAISIKDLMTVGAHFGHHTHRWNPLMKPYIFTKKSKIHILDLNQTLPLFVNALNTIEEIVAKGGRVLFVGTKRQAANAVKEQATRCGQHYVNDRWLGGTLTNWETILSSIQRLKDLEKKFETEEFKALTKKEQLFMRRDHEKLNRALGGIKDMGGLPDVVFVIDTNKEAIAIKEAQKLGIKIVAILDSNSSPLGIDMPIPANDDALKAIDFYCYMIAEAALSGLKKEMSKKPISLAQKEGTEEPASQKKSQETGLAQTSSAPPKNAADKDSQPAEATTDAKSSASKEATKSIAQEETKGAPQKAPTSSDKPETPLVKSEEPLKTVEKVAKVTDEKSKEAPPKDESSLKKVDEKKASDKKPEQKSAETKGAEPVKTAQ